MVDCFWITASRVIGVRWNFIIERGAGKFGV